MGFLANLETLGKSFAAAVTGGVGKFTNSTFLEGGCAAAAKTAYADKSIDDSEIEKTLEILQDHDSFKSFSAAEIEKEFEQCMKDAQASRISQMKLNKKIKACAGNEEQAQTILLLTMEVTDADGIVEQSEIDEMKDICKMLGLSESDYGLDTMRPDKT